MKCLLCGRELPTRNIIARILSPGPLPECRSYGLDLDQCWEGFLPRMGLDPTDHPRPDK